MTDSQRFLRIQVRLAQLELRNTWVYKKPKPSHSLFTVNGATVPYESQSCSHFRHAVDTETTHKGKNLHHSGCRMHQWGRVASGQGLNRTRLLLEQQPQASDRRETQGVPDPSGLRQGAWLLHKAEASSAVEGLLASEHLDQGSNGLGTEQPCLGPIPANQAAGKGELNIPGE